MGDSPTPIGKFSVDSGQARVGHLCYLDEWGAWKGGEPFDYEAKKGENFRVSHGVWPPSRLIKELSAPS